MENIIKAQIQFEDGKVINLDLLPDTAPLSVQNFVKLIGENYYDGLIFHRIIPGFMIQGGGFLDGMKEKKGAQTIKGEFLTNGVMNPLHHAPGVLSMARTNDKNSASSQFFICVADCKSLDGQYAAFGKCSDEASLKTAVSLSLEDTRSVGYYDDVPVDAIKIKTIVLL